jgi:mannose-6-phosphate isomerase-like protein (cupin superfamily)
MSIPVRRIVTGHDADGKAIIIMDGPAPNQKTRSPGSPTSTLLWVNDETPADISYNTDRADRTIGVPPPPAGAIMRIVDFPPIPKGGAKIDNATMLKEMGIDSGPNASAARSPFMHRTRSIDYAVVISGEIDMLMDDTEVHMKAGDTLVQQGTNHAWENHSDENCRILFVLIDAVAPPGWKGSDH